jgi:hypothetical protein
MTAFTAFARRCKMRHDFADRFQVRYLHPEGEHYYTWISGEEVLARLRAAEAEARLRKLGQSLFGDLRAKGAEATQAAKRALADELRDRLGDGVDWLAGGNPLGDGLSARIRGDEEQEPDAIRWQAYLQDELFRAAALELAWLNLRGSFPEPEADDGEEGWV